MSGTLGDVYLLRTNGCRSVAAAEEASIAMSSTSDEKDGGVYTKQRKTNINITVGGSNNNIEWQQLLKDGVNANNSNGAGNRPRSGDHTDRSRFSVLNNNSQQKFHLMGPGGTRGPWDFPKVEDRSRAVNYLQSFGPVSSGSSGGSVDRQLGEIRLALDGQGQLLTDALRRSTSGCDAAAAEVAGRVKEEEEFGGAGEPPSTSTGHVLQGGSTVSSPAQQQQLFAGSRGLGMPSSASIQQLTRSPNHAIRNLFPEKSSNFSSAGVLQSHEDLEGSNKVVAEQGLLHLPKKVRRQDFGDGGGPLSSPLSRDQVDHANRPSHGGSSGQYRKSPSFGNDQDTNSLSSLMDCSSSYNKSPTPPFSAAFPTADRSAAFNSGTLFPLPNPSSGLPCFQTSGPLMPMKNSSHENLSVKPPLVSYGNYPLDGNRMQGGCSGFRADFLVPERDSLLDVSSPQSGRSYMPLGGSLGQPAFNFSGRRQPPLDNGGRGAWPAGLINNIPSLSIDGPSGTILPSRRTLHDPEQPDGLLEDREARRIHSMSESRRRLLIQKQLTTTDVGSLGRIILPKKEAETHLPHLPDKEGMEMYMFDYEADRTWTMKYRFWPNNKSRMYLLENTGEFAKFHSLQQGDWLYIYREPLARYVLRAKKTPPLLPVTPSSQTVTEPVPAAGGPPAAEDVGGPASVSGRTMNQSPNPASTKVTGGGGGDSGGGVSTSTDSVCGTSAASCNQLSLDVPSSTFSLSGGGGGGGAKGPGQVVVAAEQPIPPNHHHGQSMLETSNSNSKHPVHRQLQQGPRPPPPAAAKVTVVDNPHHHYHPRQEQEQHQHQLKNYMAVQQQHPNHELSSELDGGGDFNLEDFPRLIEADDEIIDNFLDESDSNVSVEVRNRPHALGGEALRHGRSEQQH